MKSPAFQWYPRDYLVDERVVPMSLEEEGAYRRLMDYCWLEGSLPNDMEALASMCKRISTRRMEKLWEKIRPCFKAKGDRWRHPRLDVERRKQTANKKAKSDAGRKGAKAKHSKGNSGTATPLPVAEPSSAVASAVAVASSTSVEKKTRAKRVKAPDTALPADWRPNDKHRERAKADGLRLDWEVERFRAYHESKGNRRASWDASFTTWLLNAKSFNRPAHGAPAETPGLEREAAEWQGAKQATEARLAEERERLTKAATQRNGATPTTANEPSGPLAGILARVLPTQPNEEQPR